MLSQRQWLGLGVAIATLAACHPTVRGNFLCDDFRLLTRLVDQDFGRALFSPFNGHVIPVTIGATGALFAALGYVAWPYFLLLLGLHVANAWLLYVLAQRLTRSPPAAAVVACAWSTAPTAIETLSWYNNLGTVLMTTTTLALLGCVARRSETTAVIGVRTALAWAGLLLVAANSIAPGLAVLLVLSIALTVNPARLPITRGARAVLLLSTCAGLSIFVVSSRWWPERAHAGQGLAQSLHSFFGLWRLAIDFGLRLVQTGLSRALTGWIQPTIGNAIHVAVAAGGTVVLVLSMLEPRRRWFSFLALSAVAAVYGIIAVGRAPMVYTLIATGKRTIDQSADLARYHYLATAVFLLATACACEWLERRWKGSGRVPLGVLGAMQLAAWLAYAAPPNPHVGARTAVDKARNALADLQARAPEGTAVYIGNVSLPQSVMVGSSLTDIPGWAAIYAVTHSESAAPRVRFVEPLRQVRDAFATPDSHRLSQLMLAPWAPRGAARDCGVATARAIGSLLRDLVRCPPASNEQSLCLQRAERRLARRYGATPQCPRDPAVLGLVRRNAQFGHHILACDDSGVPPPETKACVARRRRRLVHLVRGLSRCCVSALRRSGRPDNPECTGRALGEWLRAAPQDERKCPSCAADSLLGDLTATTVMRLIDRAVPMPVAPGKAIYLREDEEPDPASNNGGRAEAAATDT